MSFDFNAASMYISALQHVIVQYRTHTHNEKKKLTHELCDQSKTNLTLSNVSPRRLRNKQTNQTKTHSLYTHFYTNCWSYKILTNFRPHFKFKSSYAPLPQLPHKLNQSAPLRTLNLIKRLFALRSILYTLRIWYMWMNFIFKHKKYCVVYLVEY